MRERAVINGVQPTNLGRFCQYVFQTIIFSGGGFGRTNQLIYLA